MVRSLLWSGLEWIGLCLLMPAIVLHELTHYIASRSIADDLRFHARPAPAVSVNWTTSVSPWRVRIAKTAPTIVGIVAAPVIAFWALPISDHDPVGIVLVVVLWLVYTKPSADDLRAPQFE